MMFYRCLGAVMALLLIVSRVHVHIAPAGVPLSVPVLTILATVTVIAIIAAVALLARKILPALLDGQGVMYAARS